MKMNAFLRNYVTPLSLVLFAAIGITGIMMWLGIHNRQLGEIHEKVGILFVIVAILHMFRNAKSFALMMAQNRSKVIVGILGAVAVLLIGSAVFTGGGFGPGGPQGRHGPGGPRVMIEQRLAYAPIAQLAPAFGLSSAQAISRLRKGGIQVAGPGQNLADIAQKQNAEVPRLLALLLSDRAPASGADSNS
jgi:hypothetical protein